MRLTLTSKGLAGSCWCLAVCALLLGASPGHAEDRIILTPGKIHKIKDVTQTISVRNPSEGDRRLVPKSIFEVTWDAALDGDAKKPPIQTRLQKLSFSVRADLRIEGRVIPGKATVVTEEQEFRVAERYLRWCVVGNRMEEQSLTAIVDLGPTPELRFGTGSTATWVLPPDVKVVSAKTIAKKIVTASFDSDQVRLTGHKPGKTRMRLVYEIGSQRFERSVRVRVLDELPQVTTKVAEGSRKEISSKAWTEEMKYDSGRLYPGPEANPDLTLEFGDGLVAVVASPPGTNRVRLELEARWGGVQSFRTWVELQIETQGATKEGSGDD